MSAKETPAATAGEGRTTLPGFGRPLNYEPQEGDPGFVRPLFPSALSTFGMKSGKTTLAMVPLRELTMLQLMNSITDKPGWYHKVNDPEIVEKWKEEALASGRDITESMINWCIEELKYKASLLPEDPAEHPPIIVYNGDVVKSDVAVPPELKKELQEAVKEFEAKIPERLKDWHPGSDEKVWDLIHPSLFPLIYGRTRVLANGEATTLEDCITRSGEGEIAPIPGEDDTHEFGKPPVHFYSWQQNYLKKPFSAKFQWLPCEVDISSGEARITTYINNLHPGEEKPLYRLIERLISSSVPLWNVTLAPLTVESYSHPARVHYDEVTYDPDPGNLPPEEGPQQGSDESEDDYYERRQAWIEDTRKVLRPEPETFKPLDEPPVFSLKDKYGQRGLQVIVKLANIELTSEKPAYNGGSWHVEGQMNEHIVATSLYYYSCENITASILSFKQQCDEQSESEHIAYMQHEHEFLSEIFGCEQDGPAVQEVGSVETLEGRLLTFPNILQHRVGPFKLKDPTKPGHRKIIALFLVDPNIKVISTAHVPCQQQEWWWAVTQSLHLEANANLGAGSRASGRGVASLPLELQDHVLEDVDFPINMQEAKKLRMDLIEERKEFVVKSHQAFEASTFSLCEH
ncbi:hypothetical protein CPB84DRAFT_1788555 [Gymnopilus junonius]|uniref:Uncharacterized protein n=1 Tax=Gymnopilus junonius TaxID=109634 RepID=A0A9P5NFH9_GYMJU|nr:hypothetical protein CPB84DRAFT_1788555 [Gymnopilus junonius]